MSGTRKLAAILAADVVGYSRLAGADEERTLARLRALRGDLIDPAVAAHRGRVVKRTGDGALVEFRSVVDAVRCALEIQAGMAERNAGVAADRAIKFRIGIHLGDVVEEEDGDLMGDGVNIAARLEGIAEPGGICLSAVAYESVRDKIDAAFADLGEKELKNIARRVRVYALAPAAAPAAEHGPPRLSIVVLPFANMGSDPEQEYFVDGVTESLTTDLSRMAGMFVIGRNTAFTYKGKAVDLKQIGRELNVRYVLEGSVQRGGNRMRVNVQLIEAESGAHLWAERFDKPVADLFDMQDEIVARLANALNTQLIEAEARRARRNPNPDSIDLYFQGMAPLYSAMNREGLTAAGGFFERAVSLDSANVDALAGLALADMLFVAVLLADDGPARLAAGEQTAMKALALAPNHANAHYALGYIYLLTNRSTQAIAEAGQALALDRNMATAHALIGFAKLNDGRAEETQPHILEALRLSPRDTIAWHWMFIAGVAEILLARDAEAVGWLRRSVENFRYMADAHIYLAAALAHLGREEEARAAAKAGLAIQPEFTIARLRGFLMRAQGDNPTVWKQTERLFDGMRKAGVPEE
ncbi:MAG TPA: adenylate/guanylate cyclase domain-containing protein [Stellaceae bacterium]